MPSLRVLTGAAMLSAVALAGCGSSSSTSNATDTTTTTIAAETTTTAVVTSTTVGTLGTTGTTVKPTATNPPATNPPATNPPATNPPVFTSINFGNTAACTDPSATFQPPPPSVTISWNAPTADSVNLYIDGGLWGTYGNSGTETLPASCDASLHNVHTYKAVAFKNGSEIASKSATRGY